MRASWAPAFPVFVCIQTYYGRLAVSQGTGSWALRVNDLCVSGDSDCGPTIDYFHACCPPSSPCQSQCNSVCCPDQAVNCTGALVASGPRCADPTYNLCDNGGYFCCLPGKLCYANGNTDGCADEGYKLSAGEYFLSTISQVQPSTTSGASQPSGNPAANQTTAPSDKTLSTSPSPSSPSSSSPSRGLNRSDTIDIAVPVAIGTPSLIISFWLALRKWRRDKHNQASST